MTPATTNPITPTAPATIGGLHHVTAITADGQANLNFYTRTLGLRLVKVTVNYDDPSSYHLYYGDRLGTPGSLLTFFVWPGGFAGKPGTGQTSHTAYAIPADAVDFWKQRLTALNVPYTEATRFTQPVLSLRDPDGLNIELIASETSAPNADTLWTTQDIPASAAIRRFHSVTLNEVRQEDPASILVDRFGYQLTQHAGNRYRYELATAGPNAAAIIDVIAAGQRNFTGGGAGSVHHIAFRTPTDDQQHTWLESLTRAHAHVSPIMNRDYFHSIYFREPGGVLFEIATDTPGMLINETAETLGSTLSLPAWMESARAEIVKVLPPLNRNV